MWTSHSIVSYFRITSAQTMPYRTYAQSAVYELPQLCLTVANYEPSSVKYSTRVARESAG
eukprot:scaffold261043_cov21-Prasinocladus_malaysianus.AAC.1